MSELFDGALIGELRRMVHELDAMPFTPRLLRPARYGGGLEHVEGTGGAGAPVYDDILDHAPTILQPTRAELQRQLEEFLGGVGTLTDLVAGALEVAALRGRGCLRSQLPPTACEVPTRLERGACVTGQASSPDTDRIMVWVGKGADHLGSVAWHQSVRQFVRRMGGLDRIISALRDVAA